MLHLVNVNQSLANGLIRQSLRMLLKGPPVLCIGPCLMPIEFVEIRTHKIPLRLPQCP